MSLDQHPLYPIVLQKFVAGWLIYTLLVQNLTQQMKSGLSHEKINIIFGLSLSME